MRTLAPLRIVVAAGCTFALGCGGSTSSAGGDSGSDGPGDAGNDATADRAAQDRTPPKDHVVSDTPGDHVGDHVIDQGPTDAGREAATLPDGATECRTPADCPGSASYEGCLQFTLPKTCGGVCSGAPLTGGCTSDAECAAEAGVGFICSSFCQCAFTGGYDPIGPWCIQGCSGDPECGPGHVCSATHHCEATPCKVKSDCDPNFVCSTGACSPAPCVKDGDCMDGYFCTTPGFDTLGGSTQLYCAPRLGVCHVAGA